MHVVCENNERHDCKNARWINKIIECMWILSQNDAWKDKLVKNLKTENFLVSISQALIRHRSNQVESFCFKT